MTCINATLSSVIIKRKRNGNQITIVFRCRGDRHAFLGLVASASAFGGSDSCGARVTEYYKQMQDPNGPDCFTSAACHTGYKTDSSVTTWKQLPSEVVTTGVPELLNVMGGWRQLGSFKGTLGDVYSAGGKTYATMMWSGKSNINGKQVEGPTFHVIECDANGMLTNEDIWGDFNGYMLMSGYNAIDQPAGH